jgi:hypothetical protein
LKGIALLSLGSLPAINPERFRIDILFEDEGYTEMINFVSIVHLSQLILFGAKILDIKTPDEGINYNRYCRNSGYMDVRNRNIVNILNIS